MAKASSRKDLRRRYLSRPPVEPMRLRPGMSVVDLVDVYRRAGAFNGGRLAEGCELFGRMLDGGTTIARTRVLFELGSIARQRGDATRAVNLLDSALDAALESGEDPTDVEQALRAMDRFDLVVRSLEWRVVHAPSGATRIAALRDLVEVWSARLGRDPELGARLRNHVAASADLDRDDVTDDAVLAASWFVHASLGDEGARLATVRRSLAVRRSGERKADADGRSTEWLLEAAAFCVEVEELDLAAEAYAMLFEANPRDRAVWLGVESVFGRLPGRDDLVKVIEAVIEAVEPPPDRASLRVRLAKLLVERSERSERSGRSGRSEDETKALTLLRTAADENPADDEATEIARGLLQSAGRFGELASLLEKPCLAHYGFR